MKKLNLFIATLLIITSAAFTSCKDNKDANPPVVTLSSSTSSVKTGVSFTLKFQINKGDNKIGYVKLFKGDDLLTDASGYIWNGGSDKTTSRGYYSTNDVVIDSATVTVSTAGTYTFKAIAYDVDGNASTTSTVDVTVTSGSTTLFSTVSTEAPNKTIYCYLADGTSGTSCFANANGKTYTPYAASNYSNYIDFVYYNKSKTYTMYSPYALNLLGETSNAAQTVAQWSILNKTTFVDVTSSINYTTATVDQVTSAAATATSYSVSNLKAGSVVVFKTASTSILGSTIGIFTVNSITDGYGSTDYINISIRTKN